MAEEKLTREQRMAVEDRGGPLLVSAAAGSGKTKVLVDRLMGYLMDPGDPADVDQFLIITYTKAAASELRAKIASKLTETLASHPGDRHLQRQLQRLYLAKISTVHSFCAEILREHAFQLDLPGDMRTAEENECAELKELAMEAVLEEAYGRIDQDADFRTFVDTQGAGRSDKDVPQIIEDIYTRARCHVDPESWLHTCTEQCNTEKMRGAEETIWGAYIMDGMRAAAEDQIALLENLHAQVMRTDDQSLKNGPVLEDCITMFRALADCKTWDSVGAFRGVSLPRLKIVKSPADPDLADRVKAVKGAAADALKAMLSPFGSNSETLLSELQGSAAAVRGLEKLVLAYGKAYDREKLRRHVLDFSDLEHKTLELLLGSHLTGPTRAAREIGARFREVMVDEYQDSNEVQDRIFSTLTSQKGNCFMVGDVKQSIYRFRLADPTIFLDKYSRFAPAEEEVPGEGRKILLSRNFRSGAAVLEAANEVFSLCMCEAVGGLRYGPGEALRARDDLTPLPQPAVELHCIEGKIGGKDQRESEFVANRIRELLDAKTPIRGKDGLRPVEPGDITILLRSPGTNAAQFIAALEARGIPVTTESTKDILGSDEISILRSLLQVLDNPLQDIPLETVLASPVFGFTADYLAKIRARSKHTSLYAAMELAGEQGDEDAREFLDRLTSFRETARLETLARLVEEIYAQTHLTAIFSAMPDGDKRRRNLEVFYEQAVSFEQGGLRDLQQFLAFLDRLEERKGLNVESGAAGGAVSIVSIHKSKGLEYPVVFLCDLAAGFNDQDTHGNVLVDSELGIGCSVLDREKRLRYPDLAKQAIIRRMRAESASEELRVLYVAMTRAKDMLIMTYATGYNLKNILSGITTRLDPQRPDIMSKEAGSLGHWVLMTALSKTEAGELFQQGGYPAETFSGTAPWKICYHAETGLPAAEAPETPAAAETVPLPPAEQMVKLLQGEYAHKAASQAPSKVTATQLKGRNLDEEAADGAFTPLKSPNRTWRKPDFLRDRPLSSREIGTATHLAMQFIRYEECGTREGVEEELKRLVQEKYLTQRQADGVNRPWITDFFASPLGFRLRMGGNVYREFKFSILEDGAALDPDLAGEQMLLQGVVDCFLLEEDGLTVLDFKTDRVKPGREADAASRYAPQVRAYGKALTRIYQKPVKKLLLWFFQTGTLCEIEP